METHERALHRAHLVLLASAQEALTDVAEYLDQRADASDNLPNEEMQLLVKVRAAIAALETA